MNGEPAKAAGVSPLADDSLVSVVIPAFNRAATIADALSSVQAQSYPNWEVIVVDDGSRDDTAGTVERCGRQDQRIRLIRHPETGGAQAARNTGIRQARGSWIAFLDSDDRWMRHSLRIRLNTAAARGLTVVHSDAYARREDGSMTPYRLPALDGWIYRELLSQPGPMFQGLLVGRDALEAIGGLDERIVALQEWDTAIRLAERYRFGFVQSPTFVWDRRCAETITKDKGRDARGYEQVVRKHAEAIARNAGAETLCRHYATITMRYLAAGEQAEAFRCLRALRRFEREGPAVVLRRGIEESAEHHSPAGGLR